MALLDSYADFTQYKDANKLLSDTDEISITDLLLLNSRRLEKLLRVAPGYFNTHTATYTFDGHGGSVLYLRDRAGLAYCLTAITADSLLIDDDADGTFDDYTLDLADAWVRGLPENAASQSEPFRRLELLPLSTATITAWPKAAASVQITGTWGWAAVPSAVRESVIALTRDARETLAAGATQQLPEFPFEVRPDTWARVMTMANLYGRKVPRVA